MEISGTTVTITCPFSGDNVNWKPNGLKAKGNKYIIEDHDSSPLTVSCEESGKKHALYLNAKGE